MESPATVAGHDESPSGKLAFAPRGGVLECASYGRVFKGIALALLGAAAVWLLQSQPWAPAGKTGGLQVSWMWPAWGLMATTAWFVCTGRTRLTDSAVEQSWMWPKRLAHSELAYAKLIRIRGLEWLIAPRLYTKNFGGKLQVFYAAAPEMLEEFKRLELALATVRQTH